VCLSVCLSTRITRKPCGRTLPIILCMLPVARFFSDGIAICYALLVLQMTSCFHTTEPIGKQTGIALGTSPLIATVSRPARKLASSLSVQAATNTWRCRDMALQSIRGPSQHLHKQSAVMTIEVATTLWLCGRLCLEGCQDSLVQCLVQFIRLWHWEPG